MVLVLPDPNKDLRKSNVLRSSDYCNLLNLHFTIIGKGSFAAKQFGD